MRLIDEDEGRKLLRRGKSFDGLVDKEKVQKFMNNFCYAYRSFYNSNLVCSWHDGLELSKKFIDYYRECRNKIGRNFYKTVLADYKFKSDLYRAVKKWVEKAAYKGCKLKSYDNFYKAIQKIGNDLEKIKKVTLESLVEKEENLSQIKETLKSIFEKLETADQNVQLVSNSKTLFHLLPDLIMPVDREHVLSFFIGRNRTNSVRREKETEYFIGVFNYYYRICKEKSTQIKNIYYKKRREYDSSIPKIIDNAICGYTCP